MSEDSLPQCATGESWKPSKTRVAWNAVKRWLFLNVWCRHMYRHVMRAIHRFDLHHAPSNIFAPQYGERNHWCQWCGLRGTTYVFPPYLEETPSPGEKGVSDGK